MTYYRFHRTSEQLRRFGARGGRTFGRNERVRRALVPPPQPTAPPAVRAQETTAAAIARLDAQCPWLHRAEKRSARRGA